MVFTISCQASEKPNSGPVASPGDRGETGEGEHRGPAGGPGNAVGEFSKSHRHLLTPFAYFCAAIFRRSKYGWAYQSAISTIMTASAAAMPSTCVSAILPTAT